MTKKNHQHKYNVDQMKNLPAFSECLLIAKFDFTQFFEWHLHRKIKRGIDTVFYLSDNETIKKTNYNNHYSQISSSNLFEENEMLSSHQNQRVCVGQNIDVSRCCEWVSVGEWWIRRNGNEKSVKYIGINDLIWQIDC